MFVQKKGFFLLSWLFTNLDGGSRGGKKMAIAAFKTCFQEILLCKQLLITEFEVGTVSQGPILCRSDLWFMREQSKMRLRDFSSD